MKSLWEIVQKMAGKLQTEGDVPLKPNDLIYVLECISLCYNSMQDTEG
jgi:hypothetical protein